ncbi:MAG: acyl-CoA desaturase, partial [Xanthomonadales bacterium]|nr:acyl-CoA desaturase [Xanthomonadales bacterium]
MLDNGLDWLSGGMTAAAWWQILLYLLISAQITIFGVTLYLHRSQAHRAVDFHPLIAHFFRFWIWLTTAMVTKEWVAIHRKHHAKCETAEDPHSPVAHGISTVVVHGVTLYQQCLNDREMIDQYGLNCPNDWIERNLY